MNAYCCGNRLELTRCHRLGEALSRLATHFLFLPATPHKGDPESFRLFLDLLEPGLLATTELLQTSVGNRDNPIFIRRVKQDLRDFEGRLHFLDRHRETKAFNLGTESSPEKGLYNALSKYVNEQQHRA